MKIKWLNKALTALTLEAEYIAQDNPEAAKDVVRTIKHTVDQLTDNPAMGRPGRLLNTRELIIPGTRYIVPYRVQPNLRQIQILQVFHTSRRPPNRW